MEGKRSPQGDSQHGPSQRFSHHAGHRHVRLPTNLSWPPGLAEKGLEARWGSRGREQQQSCAARGAAAWAPLATGPKGSWKVGGDLGQGEEAAPLSRAWSSQPCPNLQRWENLAGMSCPRSPCSPAGMEALPARSHAGPGEGVARGALAPALAQLQLSARDRGPCPHKICSAVGKPQPSLSAAFVCDGGAL